MSIFDNLVTEALYEMLPEVLGEYNIDYELVDKMTKFEYKRLFKRRNFTFYPIRVPYMYHPYYKFDYKEKLIHSLNKQMRRNKEFLKNKQS